MPGGPPLRSRHHPWGLPHSGKRQDRQVWVGAQLLYTLITLMWEAAISGGCAWIEHPQIALWAKEKPAPSIWRLDELRWMSRLQCTTVISFDQCTLGASGVKPTTLLLIRLPLFRRLVLQQGLAGRCPHAPGPHAALKGKDSEGAFCTAKAKIYPQGMNHLLAEAI